MTITRVKVSDLKIGPIRNEILPEGFIVRVQKFKEILKEVETSSLEETVSNFQRDWHPESELKIWEEISRRYELAVKSNEKMSISEKKEIFKNLLFFTVQCI